MKRYSILYIFLLIFAVTAHGFVKRVDAPEAPEGMDGRVIALWPSHGAYYCADDDRWKWQRGRLFGTVEDLFSQSYVIPFLIPMLENAGAYVMTPRERDLNTTELIIDNDGGVADAATRFHDGDMKWTTLHDVKGFGYQKSTLGNGDNPFRNGTVKSVHTVTDGHRPATAAWSAEIPERGDYAVYVSYASLPESADDAVYRVNSAAGTEEFTVDQRMGGGTWIYLGTFPFEKGSGELPLVELEATSAKAGKIITADAVKIGGGMGNVVRGGRTSGRPRHNEGARYWLQWAGMPDSVYMPSDPRSDYVDDYKSRGLWVNYLSGGSRMNPEQKGLGIPVDLSFAFHTDAGVTDDNSAVGTLAIVNYGKKDKLGNGEPRSTVADYAAAVSDQIVNDIRSTYNPDWTQRRTRNRAYHEASSPMVPALLIELLSHQNFEDLTYGLNPEFRFTVARAIYKGMLRYLAQKNGGKYTVQPLPVNSFAITGSGNDYILSWKPTVDSLETSALPDYYIVEERRADGAFSELAVVEDTWMTVNVDHDDIMSYRVVAVNRGGASFPSEVLSLCRKGDQSRQVLVVNGFTRVAGPDIINYGSRFQGMDYRSDHGVPYGYDVAFTGEQTEFRRGVEWTSDDSPGSGASRADFDNKLMAGNTFDFVYVHGKALRDAGYPFVSASREGFIASMPETKYIDLILGKQKEGRVGRASTVVRHKTFPAELQLALTRFCESGGNLIVTGSYVASDLHDNPFSSPEVKSADLKFARTVLGVDLRCVKATVTGEVTTVKSPFRSFADLKFKFNQMADGEIYPVESPDAVIPAGGGNGKVVMRYVENDFPAAVACEKENYKTVVAGFPLETVTDSKARSRIMSEVMAFFAAPKTPVVKEPQPVAKDTKSKSKSKKNKKNKKRKKRK